MPKECWVPFTTLNASTHSASARLIWILQSSRGSHSPLSAARLEELSGLAPMTVRTASERLRQAPLDRCHLAAHPLTARMEFGVLADPSLSARARLLYGQIQGAPDFDGQSGTFTYAALSTLTGSSSEALHHAMAELTAGGWVAISQRSRKRPYHFTLLNPAGARLTARIRLVTRKVKRAPHRGETLLREFLNVLVADKDCEENAAPDFLVNPYSNELMELDRYYPTARVGFEFSGDQHFEATDLSSFAETVKQVGRDAMKAFICKHRGITLVVVRPENLRHNVLDAMIPASLPRRDLSGLERLVTALERLASEYRERTAEERERRAQR